MAIKGWSMTAHLRLSQCTRREGNIYFLQMDEEME
jgi:hypothetical protein